MAMEHDAEIKKYIEHIDKMRLDRLRNNPNYYPDWSQSGTSSATKYPYTSEPKPRTVDEKIEDLRYDVSRLAMEVRGLANMLQKIMPQIDLIANVFDAMHIKEEDERK